MSTDDFAGAPSSSAQRLRCPVCSVDNLGTELALASHLASGQCSSGGAKEVGQATASNLHELRRLCRRQPRVLDFTLSDIFRVLANTGQRDASEKLQRWAPNLLSVAGPVAEGRRVTSFDAELLAAVIMDAADAFDACDAFIVAMRDVKPTSPVLPVLFNAMGKPSTLLEARTNLYQGTCVSCGDAWPMGDLLRTDTKGRIRKASDAEFRCKICLNDNLESHVREETAFPEIDRLGAECYSHLVEPTLLMRYVQTRAQQAVQAVTEGKQQAAAGHAGTDAATPRLFVCPANARHQHPVMRPLLLPAEEHTAMCYECSHEWCRQCSMPAHHFGSCETMEDQRRLWRSGELANALLSEETKESSVHSEIARLEARRAEMQQDQAHFSRTAKRCPGCGRQPLIHVGGCSSMVCGRDTHGMVFLGGCLHPFTWSAAPAYVAPPDDVYEPAIAALRSMLQTTADQPNVGGHTCAGCQSYPIRGPVRVECLCCPPDVQPCEQDPSLLVSRPIAFCRACAVSKKLTHGGHEAWHTFVVRAADADPVRLRS